MTSTTLNPLPFSQLPQQQQYNMIAFLVKAVLAAVAVKKVMDACDDLAPPPGQPFQEDGEDLLEEITDRLDLGDVETTRQDVGGGELERPAENVVCVEVVKDRDESARSEGELDPKNVMNQVGGETFMDAGVREDEEVEAVDTVVHGANNDGSGHGQEEAGERIESVQGGHAGPQEMVVLTPRVGTCPPIAVEIARSTQGL